MAINYVPANQMNEYNELVQTIAYHYVDYFVKYSVEGQSIRRFIVDSIPFVMNLAYDEYLYSLDKSPNKLD